MFYFNSISCLLLRDPLDINIRDQHFTLLLKVLTEEKSESEPAYRALVGLGNVVCTLYVSLQHLTADWRYRSSR